ncbi:signal recognition particle 9 kDa protein-domain-containing protein [Podospora fimiseda]|uniref:Signal recognition particle 9 kDa protein-domain-containing protein n=1 Tax=Podospora fimiseda TaxID=252190 RepID=A0AAN7BMG8_9PEZI|nr:signal recognition particle 9 kDa protein-domain-containing protein [Podospora fimiseda]
MPYYEKSEDWLHQSSLLLQARPSTTRLTTRYHIKPARRVSKKKSESAAADAAPAPAAAQDEKPPRGHLELKTYDPQSGVTLKYKTSKAAEVTRLIQMLGQLGRGMAGLPPVQKKEVVEAGAGDVEMVDVGEEKAGASGAAAKSGTQTPVAAGGQGGEAGKNKKKKKGKR